MTKKRVIIIGGSIAGNTMAVLMQRIGFEVTVLERSSGVANQGTGITLPNAVVEQCIALDLFDQDIPTLNITSRLFLRKDLGNSGDKATEFWTQPINGLTLNWLHVYENIHKRVQKSNYHYNTNVQQILKIDDIFHVKTSKNITYEADYIIATDGVDSQIRKQMFPEVEPNYAGYIAWRGLVECDSLLYETIDKDQIPFFVFNGGHILLYRIPAKDYAQNQKTLLNWVMYEKCNKGSLVELLTDKFGKLHTRSLPQGFLSNGQVNYLNTLAKNVLPSRIADLVIQTPKPFIQAVFDLQLPTSPDNSIIFAGDATATLRPHTASGVLKALVSSINLFNLFNLNKTQDFLEIAALWQQKEQVIAQEESKKSISMGEALVTNSPDWTQLDQLSAERWWNTVMEGKNWYITKQSERLAPKKQYDTNNFLFKQFNENEEDYSKLPVSKL